MTAILLVDDDDAALAELKRNVERILSDATVQVRTWTPAGEEDPREAFEQKRLDDTLLVVTDYDLSTSGQLGLFGPTIVEWCQQYAIPVADYSRKKIANLPKNPNFFEIRVPIEKEPAEFIATTFTGFREIQRAVEGDTEILNVRSPGDALAKILNAPQAAADFALYSIRLGPASGALMSELSEAPKNQATPDVKRRVLAYLASHLLLNAVLRFPGPILSRSALNAYLATLEADSPDVEDLFVNALYRGPFAALGPFYWLSLIDEVLDELLAGVTDSFETDGELHRFAIERRLRRKLKVYDCPRCHGRNGGYYCPFTNRTVCARKEDDCSVGSNSWIPQGARLCRIERDFFDIWSPILGL